MMKIMLNVTLLFLLVCGIAGCGQYHYQEGKTFNECKRDFSECASELSKFADSSRTGSEKSAWGSYERKFVCDCMEQKGYKLVTENDLPLRVKREDSNWLGWHHGFAGHVD